jgi:hypothetical protein
MKHQQVHPGPLPQRTAGRGQPAKVVDRRQANLKRMAHNERVLTKFLSTVGGLQKIAANLANPVRRQLDYKGITRKFFVVELMESGIPLIFDRDLPRVPAAKVGGGGSKNAIDMIAERVEVEDFEIAARPKIPYKELYQRRFRALDRAKDRLIEGIELREDLIAFSLIETASTTAGGNATVANATQGFDRDGLAQVFTNIETHRLIVGSVLMPPTATQGLRRWQWTSVDQVAMQEIRESGYLGNIWGADFYVSDQIASGTGNDGSRAYGLAQDKFLGWWPVRKDVDIIPADDPDNLRLGFVGYELIGMLVHNIWATAKFTFDGDGPVAAV